MKGEIWYHKQHPDFTPSHMRRGRKAGGEKGSEKKKAFQRVALRSKMFIHQSADALMGRRNDAYNKWCRWADAGAKR